MLKFIASIMLIGLCLAGNPAFACYSQEAAIDAALSSGTTLINLCPNNTIYLQHPIQYQFNNQQIYTDGLPTDGSRAHLEIGVACNDSPNCSASNQQFTSAVTTNLNPTSQLSGLVLRSVIVDGNSIALGMVPQGSLPCNGNAYNCSGLVTFGSASGIVVQDNFLFNSRAWSHLLFTSNGYHGGCQNALVRNNVIGPAAPVGTPNFTLSDGISLDCPGSQIVNNVISDVTDGGVIVFAESGPKGMNAVTVSSNTVQSINNDMNLAIGVTDVCGPGQGNDVNDVISYNQMIARNRGVMQLGIAVGLYVSDPHFGSGDCNTARNIVQGPVQFVGNSFFGGSISYALPVSGINNAYFSSNAFYDGNFGLVDFGYSSNLSGDITGNSFISTNSGQLNSYELTDLISHGQFILQHYRYLAGRNTGDPGGMYSWLNSLYATTGVYNCNNSNLNNFTDGFINGNQAYINSLSSQNLAINLYELVLQRYPDQGGLQSSINLINSSSSKVNAAITLVRGMYYSPEYASRPAGCGRRTPGV